MATYQGILTFHSETGTEGGYWAFQDEKFMNLPAPNHYRCSRCGRVWDKDHEQEPPTPTFTYWRPEQADGSGGYYTFDSYDPDGDLGPGELNQEFTRYSNETARQCLGGHAEWEHMYPNGMWSYEGLHGLRDGDVLTVMGDTDHEILFHGTVELPPRQDPYAPGAYVAGGVYTAHRRPPVGTDEQWWLDERRAILKTPEETSLHSDGQADLKKVERREKP